MSQNEIVHRRMRFPLEEPGLSTDRVPMGTGVFYSDILRNITAVAAVATLCLSTARADDLTSKSLQSIQGSTTNALTSENTNTFSQEMQQQMAEEMEAQRVQQQLENQQRQQLTTERFTCMQAGGTWSDSSGCSRQSSVSTQSSSVSDGGLYGQACQQATDKALSDCNFDGNSGVQGVMGMADQMKNAFDQSAMSNPQLMCSKMGQLSQAITAASAAFKTTCSVAYANCQSACQNDLDEVTAAYRANALVVTSEMVRDVRVTSNKCASLQSNVAGAADNINRFGMVQANMQYCQSLTGQDCTKNPNDPLCLFNASLANNDCSNAITAVNNPVCICQKNPNDARCGGNNLNSASAHSGSNGGGTADGNQALGDFGGLGAGNLGGLSMVDGAVKGDGNQENLSRGGSNKANLDVGGGANKGGAAGRGGAAGSGLNAKVIGGYGFGSGSGGSFGGGSGSGSGAPYGRGAGVQGQKPGVDLRQFLPGGRKDPARGLAGISGPDGITGPNTDIWQKINIRYFSVSPSLLP